MFAKLREARGFQRRHLAVLETLLDVDLLLEIGAHQERGTPLTLKRLYLLGLGSIPTLQRRLRRLRESGVVVHTRAKRDARNVELTIHPKVLKALVRLAEKAAPEEPTS